MSALDLRLFTAATDVEAAQYRILAGLRESRAAFARTRVYPHLGDLVRLRRGLRDLLDGVDALQGSRSGPVREIDWEAGALRREAPDLDGERPLLAAPLARWALPHLGTVIDEGRALYEFADEHAVLEAVGLVPPYQREGYLLVRDEGGAWRALRYRVAAVATEGDERYHAVSTQPVDVECHPLSPPAACKAALTEAYPDWPAPATFHVATAVPLPLEATVLPVVRRKLLRLLVAPGQA